MYVTGAWAPENDSVTVLVALKVWGRRSDWCLMIWPSAPESRMVGMGRMVAVLAATLWSGGCGGGLHLGGDLALSENPEIQFVC